MGLMHLTPTMCVGASDKWEYDAVCIHPYGVVRLSQKDSFLATFPSAHPFILSHQPQITILAAKS